MLFKILLLICFVFISVNVSAANISIPRVLAYQSAVYDGAGNPVADGDVDAVFRISDVNGAVVYEELQRLTVVRGVVSALVGSGEVGGAVSTGIPDSILFLDGPKFLSVEILGYPPTSSMEIASVPFAIAAESSAKVLENGVDSASIADKSIKIDDLNDEVFEKLFGDVAKKKEVVFKSDLESVYRAPSSAARIGVERGLNYSGANDLQGVLLDLDRAIRQREERVVAEENTRNSADASLNTKLGDETSSRINADGAINEGILNLQEQVDDLKVYTGNEHNHGGAGQGGVLFGGALWFDAGKRNHGETLTVADGFDKNSCSVTASVGQFVAGGEVELEGIDDFCAEAAWLADGKTFEIHCKVHGGYDGSDCAGLFSSPDGYPCVASYTVICAKR